jgi:uroporphyrinogen decarboxylase
MTPRERFIAALERKPLTGRVPHFELVNYLTMEMLGRVHPLHRDYSQWDQMSATERDLHLEDMADIYIKTAEKCEWSAILVMAQPWSFDAHRRLLERVRKKSGNKYFLMMHGDSTFAIPDGQGVYEFSMRMYDDPQSLKDEAARNLDEKLKEQAELAKDGLCDGLALCSDYCFNSGPFISPAQFDEFIFPWLKSQIAAQREMGYYVIKHTDGNIMPILDRLVEANPHALHSLDPQGGVDIAEIKRLHGRKICLVGNVNCGLMDTGSDEQVIESARYSLRNGMPGGGYIFSTSNCIYAGMRPARYELILDIWRREGNYPTPPSAPPPSPT